MVMCEYCFTAQLLCWATDPYNIDTAPKKIVILFKTGRRCHHYSPLNLYTTYTVTALVLAKTDEELRSSYMEEKKISNNNINSWGKEEVKIVFNIQICLQEIWTFPHKIVKYLQCLVNFDWFISFMYWQKLHPLLLSYLLQSLVTEHAMYTFIPGTI